MGCEVKRGYDGRELDVHRFDSHSAAVRYLTTGRGYTFERHETWGDTSGIAFFAGPTSNFRAALREDIKDGSSIWIAYFWDKDSPHG